MASHAHTPIRRRVDLHLRTWEAEGTARGTAVLVHGLGEHIGRYEHVAGALSGDGWRVAGYDHRGHGQSGGPRGGLATTDDLLQDLATMIDHVRADGQLVLLGHSVGGAIVGRFVLGMNPAQKGLPSPFRGSLSG